LGSEKVHLPGYRSKLQKKNLIPPLEQRRKKFEREGVLREKPHGVKNQAAAKKGGGFPPGKGRAAGGQAKKQRNYKVCQI